MDVFSGYLLAVFITAFVIIGLLYPICKTPSSNLPGPWGLPFFGYYFFLGPHPHLKLKELGRQYGPIFGMKVGLWSVVVVNDRNIAVDALRQEVFSDRPSFKINDILSSGNLSFLPYDEDWKHHLICIRSLWARYIKSSESVLQDVVNSEVRLIIEKSLAQTCFNLKDRIRLSTVSVMYQMCYGQDKHVYSDPDYITLLKLYSQIKAFPAGENVFHFINFVPWLSYLAPEFETHTRKLFSNIRSIHKRKVLCSEQICFANYLRKASETNKFPEHVIGSMNAIWGAAIVNPWKAFVNTLELMAQYPAVQQQVREELVTVLGSNNPPTWRDRTKLPYTESVILETLRFRPVDTMTLPHRVKKDSTLAGFNIKEGSLLIVNIYATQCDENDWLNPHVFQADRFLNDHGEIDNVIRNRLLTFSSGRRQCFGQMYAMKEIFLFFTGLLQRCLITLDDGEDNVLKLSEVKTH